jgi:HPr kinase/phosphorylase
VGHTGATEAVVHGTAVVLGNRAALLRGPSGSGKSDLAVRALGQPKTVSMEIPFTLVADDQVVVRVGAQGLTVSPPSRLSGLIEVRGLGIVTVPYCAEAQLSLLVNLVDHRDVDRLPDPWPTETLLGVALPVMNLTPFEASAPLKLALALLNEPWRGSRT